MSEEAKTPQQAREQAAEYLGFVASSYITAGGETFEIPNPGMLDDDQQERYDELQAELETYDHREVTARNPITNEVIVDPKTGEPVVDRVLINPHQIDGKLVKPPYNVRLAIALFGEDGYKKFKAGGGRSSQIAVEWARMNRVMKERISADSKSADSAVVPEKVSDGD